mmetsp:Transcript_30518/g.46814  ORF Transcript_30518/g.46814 Transcript_30518/m.46814 type:complete len:1387 (+) Transcript_30518:134-4294(+)
MSSQVSINALLKKLDHHDKDERYMATSDLCEVLKRLASGTVSANVAPQGRGGYDSYASSSAQNSSGMDASTERRICTAVLKLLHDKSNDVQAIAVKTLGVLLTTVHEEQVLEIADSLADQVLDAGKSELRDVYAIGLRTLCKTVPPHMGDRVSQRLVVRLLEGIRTHTESAEHDKSSEDIVLACLDVLTDLLARFGATASSVTREHEHILHMCLTQLASDAHVVRKRAGNTIGCLSVVLSDQLLSRMVESLLSQIDMAEGVGKSGKRKTRLAHAQAQSVQTGRVADTRALIRTMCTVSGAVGHRLGQTQIDRILPIFLRFCDPDDAVTGDDALDDDEEMGDGDEDQEDEAAVALANELRESCFTGFESFVSRCPTEVERHLELVIQAALAYMNYDPNYSYGDDEEEDEEDDEYEGGDDDDDDDEYDDDDDDSDDDDDDDDSWKVRRSAIRALTAVVEATKHQPAVLWTKEFNIRKDKTTTVANALVNRFKEREENCRVDVIDCFTRLLSVTVTAASAGVVGFASPDDMDTSATEGGPVIIDLRSKYVPTVVKACQKLLSIKKGNERSKSSALSLLSTLCLAPGGVGGADEINSVFTHIQSFLAMGRSGTDGHLHREASSKSLKLDALCLVRVMLSCNKHDPVHIKNGILQKLLTELCLSVKEHWYKVIAETLRVLAELPRFFVTGYSDDDDAATKKKEMDNVASSLYDAIEPLLAAHDVDQEIKECALSACASLLSALHSNLTSGQMGIMLTLLLERLRNETTRIAAIKTLSAIAAASEGDSMEVANMDLSPILGDAISAMASFLKQQSRSLKQSSLEALNIVITYHGSGDASLADGQLFASVLEELANLIVDSDLHLSHLSLRVSISILKVCPACRPHVKTHVLPPALAISTSPLLQDLALESLLALLEQLVISDAVEFSDLLTMLRGRLDSKETISKHSLGNLAKCIGTITAVTNSSDREEVVDDILSSLETASDPRNVQLSLLVSGDLGRVVDLSSMPGVADRLLSIYINSFDSGSEEAKHAAAYALGHASYGAKSVFLSALLDALEKSSQKKQYLLLSALRDFIQCHQKSGSEDISSTLPVIVPHLVTHSGDTEEGVRTMVAECMGSLTCLQPAPMLQKLQELVSAHSSISSEGGRVAEDSDSKKNVLVCWTVATSIKLAIAGRADAAQLSPFMQSFLKLLDQEVITVRNAALLMVYSAVHHMPQLVAGFMKEIMQPLYEVAELKMERKVDLGPFTHTVDDALPLRKAALSIFATCLEKLPGSLDITAFMPVLAKALRDVEDIQLQAHQIVISMCMRQPTYIAAAVETFCDPLEKTINKKTGQKTGTELERANEWIKSGLRTMVALSRLDGSRNCRKFADFVERTKGNAKFRQPLEAIEEER